MQQNDVSQPATPSGELLSLRKSLRFSISIVLLAASITALMLSAQLIGMAMHWAMALE